MVGMAVVMIVESSCSIRKATATINGMIRRNLRFRSVGNWASSDVFSVSVILSMSRRDSIVRSAQAPVALLHGNLLNRPALDLAQVDLDPKTGRVRRSHPTGLKDHSRRRPAEGVGIHDPETQDEL